MYNKTTTASLDHISQEKVWTYSNTRKYVRGYYFEFDKDLKTVKVFEFYDPQITEIGLELLKFLTEKELEKRKKMWKNLLTAGAEIVKTIAPLILQLLN